ncbi:MAG: 50S ribosomal protein L3 [Candidatus Altiarchaeota archaeon]|nr:50S ribosomal protein L3 [Candidatus Altiarchaeota archaeon]
MAKRNKPVAGSRQFRPLKRAKKEVPRVQSWPVGESMILGFTGYKAGMTHCIALDEDKNSPTSGSEIFVPVTIIETPPMKVVGVRLYRKGYGGEQAFTDIWCDTPDKEVLRRTNLPKKTDSQTKLEEATKNLSEVTDIKLITHTTPALTNSPKKIPDIMEMALKGENSEKLEYAKQSLGKEVRVSDVFKEMQFVDVTSVTRGKGYSGVIKRYGVRRQPRKSKGKVRHIGTGGSWSPAHKLWVEPLPGQLGYQTRTEYNKLVMKIGENGEEINPAGGFLKYGPVKTQYVMVYGSVPGPAKRVVRLTYPRRDHKPASLTIKHIDTSSKQGI